MSYTLTFIVIFGLIVLIVLWQMKANREAKRRQFELEESIRQRAKARKEMKAWENIPKTRMDKPTKLPTVHKRALTVPNMQLKPSYPPSNVVAVDTHLADQFLKGVEVLELKK